MPTVFSEKVKNKLGVEVAEELLVVMQTLIAEKSVPKDEMGSKLGAIEIRLIAIEKNYEKIEKDYAGITGQIGGITGQIDRINIRIDEINARIDKIHERMENLEARLTEQMHGLHKLLISQTKWMMGTIFLVIGALITAFITIFKFVG
ncbi:MAG: hypothetical protein AB1567_10425 [bacterium]